MSEGAEWELPALADPGVDVVLRDDGATILRSATPLGEIPRCLGDLLVANASTVGERVFLGERQPAVVDGRLGPWTSLPWGAALERVEALAGALLDLGASPERPLLLLSGNSIAHALLTLAAMHVGIPAAAVSVAYSLVSRDHAKLRLIVDALTPGVVFTETPEPFARALHAAKLESHPLICLASDDPRHHLLADLQARRPDSRVASRFAQIGPNTIAKVLFTSGSTGLPKGVINTQRMLCSNQAALAQAWPFLGQEAASGAPPVICDWLPWNHTFGANFNFNMILRHAGTLWIDGGKPAPHLFSTTLANLRERAPTLYFNVPRGFALLIPELEQDSELRDHFFSRLRLIFYAAAALPQNLWERLERLAILSTGKRVLMVSAWGSTETAPCSTVVHWPIERAGVIGNPMPGTEIALLPDVVVEEDRANGSLEVVLEDLVGAEIPVSLVYADREYLDPKVRAFVDLAAEMFVPEAL